MPKLKTMVTLNPRTELGHLCKYCFAVLSNPKDRCVNPERRMDCARWARVRPVPPTPEDMASFILKAFSHAAARRWFMSKEHMAEGLAMCASLRASKETRLSDTRPDLKAAARRIGARMRSELKHQS